MMQKATSVSCTIAFAETRPSVKLFQMPRMGSGWNLPCLPS